MKPSAEKLIRPDILGMPAYKVADATGLIKLDAMENPFRLPEDLRLALGQRLADAAINRYPDPASSELKRLLAESFAIPPQAEVLLGNGSDEIITLVTQALHDPVPR